MCECVCVTQFAELNVLGFSCPPVPPRSRLHSPKNKDWVCYNTPQSLGSRDSARVSVLASPGPFTDLSFAQSPLPHRLCLVTEGCSLCKNRLDTFPELLPVLGAS